MDTLWETQGSVTFPRILQLVDWNGSNNQASVFLVLAQSRDLRGDFAVKHDKWSEQLKGEEKKEIKKPIKNIELSV